MLNFLYKLNLKKRMRIIIIASFLGLVSLTSLTLIQMSKSGEKMAEIAHQDIPLTA